MPHVLLAARYLFGWTGSEIPVASSRRAMLCGRVPLVLADCGDDVLVSPATSMR